MYSSIFYFNSSLWWSTYLKFNEKNVNSVIECNLYSLYILLFVTSLFYLCFYFGVLVIEPSTFTVKYICSFFAMFYIDIRFYKLLSCPDEAWIWDSSASVTDIVGLQVWITIPGSLFDFEKLILTAFSK